VADCLFCKIAAKEADSEVVKESTRVLAFRDINPAAPTHVLVIPKEHLESVRELTGSHGEVLAEMFDLMTSIASDEGLEGGFRIVTNTGLEAGQSVSHLHFHLLGGRPMSWPPG
jgi:histidine triad (HIT) family protein